MPFGGLSNCLGPWRSSNETYSRRSSRTCIWREWHFSVQCYHQSFSYTCKTPNQTSVAYWPFSPHNVKITIIEHGLITVIKCRLIRRIGRYEGFDARLLCRACGPWKSTMDWSNIIDPVSKQRHLRDGSKGTYIRKYDCWWIKYTRLTILLSYYPHLRHLWEFE